MIVLRTEADGQLADVPSDVLARWYSDETGYLGRRNALISHQTTRPYASVVTMEKAHVDIIMICIGRRCPANQLRSSAVDYTQPPQGTPKSRYISPSPVVLGRAGGVMTGDGEPKTEAGTRLDGAGKSLVIFSRRRGLLAGDDGIGGARVTSRPSNTG